MTPMTPPDCDLRGLPFMPLDVVRLGDSDLMALSTGEEFKAAVALWCKAWLQVPAASLPNDERVLAFLTGLGSRWKKVREMALRGWVLCDDGRLYHPVIAEKAREAWKHRQAQRDRANKRWGNATAQSDGSAAAYAAASHPAMQGTGTVKGEEEKKTETASDDAALAFSGRIIRLNLRDLQKWEQAFPSLDLRAVLQARDDWLVTEADDATRRKWFLSTSSHLKNLQQKATEGRRDAKTYADRITV